MAHTVKITDSDDWFNFYCNDKEGCINTMRQNMQDDIEAGYDPNGHSIQEQRAEIRNYTEKFYATLDMFKTMDDKAVNRWCFYELVKTGAIE